MQAFSESGKTLVILETCEQAVQFMKSNANCEYDVLPIDYNARLALKGYKGKVIHLSDFFDDEGHRYAVREVFEKLKRSEPSGEERFIMVFRRYLLELYYNYYFLLDYVIRRLQEKYERILYYKDRFRFVCYDEDSPLNLILSRVGINCTPIGNLVKPLKRRLQSRFYLFLNGFANKAACLLYGRKKFIMISGTGYNLLKAVRLESIKPVIDISHIDFYTARHFLVQMYLLLRSFFLRRNYEYPDARIILSDAVGQEFSGSNNLFPCMKSLFNIRHELSKVLKELNPAYYVSQNAVGFHDMVNAEIKKLGLNCTTIMIPHGSNFNPSDQWAAINEDAIAKTNADNEFDYTYIQSSLFEKYVIYRRLKKKFRYGTKFWGKNFNIRKQIGLDPKKINVLYAASSYGHPGCLRLNIWLLHDEFMRDLKKIIGIISGKGFHLTVKLRANIHRELLEEGLRDYADWDIVDNPYEFSEIMENYDVLITFRSTVIDEALQMNKPVVLFDYSGRYKAIPDDNETVFYVTKETLSTLPEVLQKAKNARSEAFLKYKVPDEPLFEAGYASMGGKQC